MKKSDIVIIERERNVPDRHASMVQSPDAEGDAELAILEEATADVEGSAYANVPIVCVEEP